MVTMIASLQLSDSAHAHSHALVKHASFHPHTLFHCQAQCVWHTPLLCVTQGPTDTASSIRSVQQLVPADSTAHPAHPAGSFMCEGPVPVIAANTDTLSLEGHRQVSMSW
jgi:hypothetical protein